MSPKPRNKNKQRFIPSKPSDEVLHEFSLPTHVPGLNAFSIGSSVFQTEQALRDNLIRKVIIPVYGLNRKQVFGPVAELIHELLIFTLAEDIDVSFRTVRNDQASFELTPQERSVRTVCLFSGGTDSYSGVLTTQSRLGDIEAIFCAHTDQTRTIQIVDRLARTVLRPSKIDVIKVKVPRIEAKGYAQLRGFLYLLAASSVAHKLGSETIVVTECGPTMYQPRFSPLDSVTMTTHPFVVRTAASVASHLLQREVHIITPFENLTKAEVIAISPEKDGLKYTHSCISQRFGTHDGTCYGCIIRRLATIAAAVPDVKYARNPLSDSNANAGNLYALLDFCYQVLTDFHRMEEYQRGIIDSYKKRDLFRRFSLDNFAAVHRLVLDNKRLVRPIRDIYQSLTEKVGTQVFQDRLAQLAAPTVKPNFNS